MPKQKEPKQVRLHSMILDSHPELFTLWAAQMDEAEIARVKRLLKNLHLPVPRIEQLKRYLSILEAPSRTP